MSENTSKKTETGNNEPQVSTTSGASNEIPLKEFVESQKGDDSWKKEPWINKKDGFLYRRNRVKNENGTFSVFDVRVGNEPVIEPETVASK